MVCFVIVLLSKYYLVDKVKQDKIGERCSMQGWEMWDGKLEGTEHFEDLGVDGNIILKLIK